MSTDNKETYRTRLRQYKRREQLAIWVAAGIAGLIALLALGAIPESKMIFKRLVITVIVVAGGTFAMARVKFEWCATQIQRKIDDNLIKDTDDLPESERWPALAEFSWLISLWAIFAGGLLILVAIWLDAVKSVICT